jgi:hypothetical protein
MFDTPLGAVAVFLAFSSVTWLVVTIADRRRHLRRLKEAAAGRPN